MHSDIRLLSWTLAGSYVEVALFTLACVLLRTYYRAQLSTPSHRRSPMAVRAAVGSAFLTSVVGLFSVCGVMYFVSGTICGGFETLTYRKLVEDVDILGCVLIFFHTILGVFSAP
jgi:hypothetical protein